MHYAWKFIDSIYVENIALSSDVDLKYTPTDLHKTYIISKQTHIYHIFSLQFTRRRSCATILHQPSDILIRKSI